MKRPLKFMFWAAVVYALACAASALGMNPPSALGVQPARSAVQTAGGQNPKFDPRSPKLSHLWVETPDTATAGGSVLATLHFTRDAGARTDLPVQVLFCKTVPNIGKKQQQYEVDGGDPCYYPPLKNPFYRYWTFTVWWLNTGRTLTDVKLFVPCWASGQYKWWFGFYVAGVQVRWAWKTLTITDINPVCQP